MGAAELVDQLADPHRYSGAYQQLIGLGADAAGAARDGLAHDSPRVRMLCCKVLDHVMDPGGIPALVDALADPAEDVRVRAMAAELVGAWVHTHPDAAGALSSAARDDASPAVRKKASWYAPGGVIYARTSPRLAVGEANVGSRRYGERVLDSFHPAVRAWFERRFPAGPTEPQAGGWREIAAGRHTLIAAPTGSGKTLAAFLVCIDRLYRQGTGDGVSPCV